MLEMVVAVPPAFEIDRLPALAEEVCGRHGLAETFKGTLAAYRGCLHWHFARPGTRGTLELTFWPARRRLWIKVSDNRRAEWIDEVLPTLASALRSALEQAASVEQ